MWPRLAPPRRPHAAARIRIARPGRRPGMTPGPPPPRDDAAAPPAGRRGRRVLAALAGILAAAVGLGAAELVAGVVGTAGSPVLAVGNAAIALTPEPVKAFAIATFGTDDKTA